MRRSPRSSRRRLERLSPDRVCPVRAATAGAGSVGTVHGMSNASDPTDEQWALLEPVGSGGTTSSRCSDRSATPGASRSPTAGWYSPADWRSRSGTPPPEQPAGCGSPASRPPCVTCQLSVDAVAGSLPRRRRRPGLPGRATAWLRRPLGSFGAPSSHGPRALGPPRPARHRPGSAGRTSRQPFGFRVPRELPQPAGSGADSALPLVPGAGGSRQATRRPVLVCSSSTRHSPVR